MEWFDGNISEAVERAKATNACLVVFVEGTDTSSRRLENFFEDANIYRTLNSPQFLCIRFTENSAAYVHFESIYRLVRVPSIVFIDNRGTPIEEGTEHMQSVNELQQKIENVREIFATTTRTLARSASEAATMPLATISSEATTIPSATTIRSVSTTMPWSAIKSVDTLPSDTTLSATTTSSSTDSPDGGSMLPRTSAQRKKPKSAKRQAHLEERLHRKTLVEQATTRLEFRLANGETFVHVFQAQQNLIVVRNYVREELLGHNPNFTLATSYPRRELLPDCDELTLAELQLCPGAVILVLMTDAPRNIGPLTQRFDSLYTIMSNVYWTLLSPFLYLTNAIFRRAPTPNNNNNNNHDAQSTRDVDSRLDAPAAAGREDVNDAVSRGSALGSDGNDENATRNDDSTQQQ